MWFISRKKQEKVTEPETNTASGSAAGKAALYPASDFMDRLGETGAGREDFARKVLSLIAREKEILQGVFLIAEDRKDSQVLTFLAGYACNKPASEQGEFLWGEGLPGEVARNGKILNLKEVPQGYVTIRTGLGEASPRSLLLFPLLLDKKVTGVIELASFYEFTPDDESYFNTISPLIAAALKKLAPAAAVKTKKVEHK